MLNIYILFSVYQSHGSLSECIHTHTLLNLSPTFTILFTFEDDEGGGISGLGSISSSGTRSGLSEKMLSKSICLNKNMEL